MNYREPARNFAEAFIQGNPEKTLKEIAMTIPLVEWSLCFENWSNCDIVSGIMQSGVTSRDMMKVIAEVGYNLASNKPVTTKVRINSGIPELYSSTKVPKSCQDELIAAYSLLL